MKKAQALVVLILLFFVIYLLQVNFFSWFNLAGVRPNLFVIFVLSIGLFAGREIGSISGIFFGVSLDFFLGKSIGISAIMLGEIGFLGGQLNKSFSKDSRITMITMTTIATFIYEIGQYILNYSLNSARIEMFYFIQMLLLELIFNGIITIIIYPLIIKLGYKLEERFRKNKILTRYF